MLLWLIRLFIKIKMLKKESAFSDNSPSIPNDISQLFELIRFDKKLNIFLGICVGFLLILSLLKIYGSSVAAWNDRIPEVSTSTKNIITSTPKVIRMDEYAVLTPFTLSQVKKDFSIKNESIGGENAPLVSFLPTKHFITFFRPNFWGYFFLSPEQGFAWAWNFKALGILITMTLMFTLLTGNNFWLSIFGAFWMLFSSGTQWWYSTYFTRFYFLGCYSFYLCSLSQYCVKVYLKIKSVNLELQHNQTTLLWRV